MPRHQADTSREPCPDRILDDAGGGFAMGAVGGSVVYFLKGLRNSPKGERFSGAAQSLRMNAPRLAGSFAVWGGLFSTFDCAAVYVRQKEDPWNSIISGAATGGILSLRQGLRASAKHAAMGAALLAMIEGSQLMLTRMPQELPQHPAGLEVEEDGWLARLLQFRWKQEEKVVTGGDVQPEGLESFATPSAPVPSFEYN